MMKFLIIFTVIVVATQATVTKDDIIKMISDLESKNNQLEIAQKYLEMIVENTIKDLRIHTQEDNGEDGAKCADDLIKPYVDTVYFKSDECIGGYLRSSRSLIGHLKSGKLDEGELEHTKHMLSKTGSYYNQMYNAIAHLVKDLNNYTQNFIKSVHDRCCKHD